MGITVPSTLYILELANIFNVSTDFLFGLKTNSTINTEGLTPEDIKMVYSLVELLKSKNAADEL